MGFLALVSSTNDGTKHEQSKHVLVVLLGTSSLCLLLVDLRRNRLQHVDSYKEVSRSVSAYLSSFSEAGMRIANSERE